MTRSLATTLNNDILLGADGNLAFVSGLDAVIQNCRSVMQTRLEECALNITRGLPFFGAAFDRLNPAQFEAAGRAMLATITGVISVKTFQVTRNGVVMNYAATIQTIYGDGEVNG